MADSAQPLAPAADTLRMLTDPLLSDLWTTALAAIVNRPPVPHAGVTDDEIRRWRYAGRARA